jgi:hypothetical protein
MAFCSIYWVICYGYFRLLVVTFPSFIVVLGIQLISVVLHSPLLLLLCFLAYLRLECFVLLFLLCIALLSIYPFLLLFVSIYPSILFCISLLFYIVPFLLLLVFPIIYNHVSMIFLPFLLFFLVP